nr:putative ribonuclease h protein [Quercus suber]
MIPPPSLPPDAKVCTLIDPESTTWKVDQVQQLFTPLDAKLILNMPLSARRPTDRLIWSYTPMGVFTTQSAYKMLANSAMANNASSSNPNPQKQFWSGLWKLQVPDKMKVFAWRACNRALPTTDNLTRWHIIDVNLCPVCKAVAEDPLHMVLNCLEVEPVWREHVWFSQAISSPPIDFTDLMSRFLQVTEDNRAELFICPQSLQQRRNKLRIGLPSPQLNLVGPQAAKFLQDYLNAQEDQLPGKVCKTVMIPPPSLPPDAKVCTLIDPESTTWKVDQV